MCTQALAHNYLSIQQSASAAANDPGPVPHLRLPQLLRRLREVQDVVHHLERKAQVATVLEHRILHLRGSAHQSAPQARPSAVRRAQSALSQCHCLLMHSLTAGARPTSSDTSLKTAADLQDAAISVAVL